MPRYFRKTNYEMTGKPNGTTASRRPTEEPAQSEGKSSGNGNTRNDGCGSRSDKPECHSCAEFLSDGDPDNNVIISSTTSDNLHGEDKGGGERVHTLTHTHKRVDYEEQIVEQGVRIEHGMVGGLGVHVRDDHGDLDSGRSKLDEVEWPSRRAVLKLTSGYIKAVKEIARHIVGTSGRAQWTSFSQASKGMTHILERWWGGNIWAELPRTVRKECTSMKDGWISSGNIPSTDDCGEAIRTIRQYEHKLLPHAWTGSLAAKVYSYPKEEYSPYRNASERYWGSWNKPHTTLQDDYELAWGIPLHSDAFDGQDAMQLLDGCN